MLSAKSVKVLLDAVATDREMRLPNGAVVGVDDADRDLVLSEWLGREVTLLTLEQSGDLTYEMTFDPPDDEAEYFEIPLPEHGFVDLAPLHLIASRHVGRPAPLGARSWTGTCDASGPTWSSTTTAPLRRGRMGRRPAAHRRPVRRVDRPADGPLRHAAARPAGDWRTPRRSGVSPSCYRAMEQLHEAHPNHLGVYVGVVTPGRVSVGDAVVLERRVTPDRCDTAAGSTSALGRLRAMQDGAGVEPLIDGYGRVATDLRVSVTDRCDLRCTYCMPEEGLDWLAPEAQLSFDEIIRVTADPGRARHPHASG